MYKLFTDVTADLPLDYVQAHDLEVLPLTVSLDGVDYSISHDPAAPRNVDFHDYYEKLRAGSESKTAQVSLEDFLEFFTPVLKEGSDIFYSCFSSGLSGTCNSAVLAAEMLREQFPERQIRIVDSLSASLGHGLLVYLLVEKMEAGASIDELEQYANEMKLRVHHWFTVDDLQFLKRGGRVSSTAAFFGTVLSIKPVLNVDDAGHLIPKEKMQGRKRALKALVDHMQAACDDPSQCDPVFVSHGDALPDALLVAKMVKERFGVEAKIVNYISPIIGCHSGPGTVALFFVGDKPRG